MGHASEANSRTCGTFTEADFLIGYWEVLGYEPSKSKDILNNYRVIREGQRK
jgi:hypothetical protein